LPANISFRGFNLDDLGSHLAHDLGAIGTKHNGGEINDADPLQGAWWTVGNIHIHVMS
jgi:hypothetical protein